MKFSVFLFFSWLAVFQSQFAMASDDMTIFLKSSGYGAAAGAVIGMASLALSENPDNKINNVARGASLGLYAGIGFGLYTLYGPRPAQRSEIEDLSMKLPQLWLSPIFSENSRGPTAIDGAQLNFSQSSF